MNSTASGRPEGYTLYVCQRYSSSEEPSGGAGRGGCSSTTDTREADCAAAGCSRVSTGASSAMWARSSPAGKASWPGGIHSDRPPEDCGSDPVLSALADAGGGVLGPSPAACGEDPVGSAPPSLPVSAPPLPPNLKRLILSLR